MGDPAQKLLDQVMQLPESERRRIAEQLLDTVSDEPSEEIEHAWIDEACRRLDDINAGRAQPVSWEAVRGRIFARG